MSAWFGWIGEGERERELVRFGLAGGKGLAVVGLAGRGGFFFLISRCRPCRCTESLVPLYLKNLNYCAYWHYEQTSYYKITRLRTIRPFIRGLFSPPARKIPQTGTAVDGPAAAATSSLVELSASDPPSIPPPLLQFPPMARTHTHTIVVVLWWRRRRRVCSYVHHSAA